MKKSVGSVIYGPDQSPIEIIVSGRKAGFSTQDLPDMGGHLSGHSGLVILAGRVFHLGEALVYNVLPIDLFRSWPALVLGTLTVLAFIAVTIAAARGLTGLARTQALARGPDLPDRRHGHDCILRRNARHPVLDAE